jgi:hypothetical protein
MFVDGAAGLILAVPALDGGLMLHMRMLSHNVLRAEAQRRGLGRARLEDRTPLPGVPPPSGSNPVPPSDLHAQVLPGDLMAPLKHRVVSSPVAWHSHTHTRPSGHSRSFLSSTLSPVLISPENIRRSISSHVIIL